ncbi:MAG TPA: hypothetical protein VGJ57_12445 [Nitrospirales bacterium]|jgi:hypothetical protein
MFYINMGGGRPFLNRRKAFAVVLVVTLGMAYLAGETMIRRQLAAPIKEDIQRFVFYSDTITSKPHKEISFRLYGKNATLLLSSQLRLNNLGLFSDKEYSFTKRRGEYRIVVIGQEQTASSVADRSWPDFLEDELNAVEGLKVFNRTFKVFNVGWPDAGFAHYEQYWKTIGKEFHPDLVVLNIVESDFWRGREGSPITFKGKPIHTYRVPYKLGPNPEDVALLNVSGIMPDLPLNNPDATTSWPFAIFCSRHLMDDVEKVKALQRQITEDFVEGALPTYHPILWGRLIGRYRKDSLRRKYDPLPDKPVDLDELVADARRHLHTIIDDHPNVMIVHNANYWEIFPKAKFNVTQKLEESDPAIRVIDMRDHLPISLGEEEVKSWYWYPMMIEKWSNKGHRVYGKAAAKVVSDRLITELKKR